MGSNKVPTPPTMMLAETPDLVKAADELGFPLVVKIPDGSFSRGVHKVAHAWRNCAASPTSCSRRPTCCWRRNSCRPNSTGASACSPASRCSSASTAWRAGIGRSSSIGPNGAAREGGSRTFDIAQTPPEVIDLAVRAAKPIGQGLYGVDLKQTDSGIVVMEVNDNPNLEHGVEDAVGKDEVWVKLLKWFIERFEQ